MPRRQPLPRLWLITDARNDSVLDRIIARLPRGAGVIFRHYHLASPQRAARLAEVARLCRRFGHRLEIAVGGYGAPAPHRRLVTVHSLHEIGRANRFGAEAVLLSPVFPTRSHPGARPLGPLRFRMLAKRSTVPVIALGGINRRSALRLKGFTWAAIDGLNSKDS